MLVAARALGLDCDSEFFTEGRWKANFLLNLGYGDPAGRQARNPRLTFDDACRIM